MPGQRETKREIKLIKSFVKINPTSVNLAAEIRPVVWKRALRRAVASMTNKKSHSCVNSAAGFRNRSHSSSRLQTSPDRRDELFQNGRKIECANPSARMSTLNILQVTSRPRKEKKESELLNNGGFLFFPDT